MGRGLNGSDTSAKAIRGRMRLLVLAALLCAFQFYANAPVLDHDWVDFDDDINIVLNPHLTGGTSDTLKWAWSDTSYNRRYMPVGWMMFDGLFSAGGLSPAAYHAASWLLSAVNAVVLLFIVRRFILRLRPTEIEPGWIDRSAALVTVFLSVHPLRAETVGWASGLLYLGSTLLASTAVLAAFPIAGAPPQRTTEWLGRGLFLLSLLLYPVCVGLPLLLIMAAAFAPGLAGWRESLAAVRAATRRYAGWLLIAAGAAAVNVWAAASSRAFSALDDLQQYTLVARLGRSALLLGHLLTQIAWPGLTSPYYGDLGAASAARKILIPCILLAALAGFLAWPRTRRTAALFTLTWLSAVLPFIGLLDRGQTANDRYAFLLLGMLAVGAAARMVRIASLPGRLLAAGVLVVATVLMMPAYRRALQIWHDTDTLQARINAVTAARPEVRLNFARPATNYFLRGRYTESQQLLRQGFARFGAAPDLLAAARFIEETRTALTGDARDPLMPPYAYMHLDLARMHTAAGHDQAAKIHTRFARQFAPPSTLAP